MNACPAQSDPGLAKVFEAIQPRELATKLGITRPAVLQWRRVPPGRVLAVEKITGVSRHIQRPDIYGARAGAGPERGRLTA